MNTELKNLLNSVEEVLKYEEVALKYVAHSLNIKYDNKTESEIYNEILSFEREGKTGYDCGWIYVISNSSDDTLFLELHKYLKDNQHENIIAKTFHNTLGNPIPAIEFKLSNNSLYVQSTTIKKSVNKFVLSMIDKPNWSIITVLD